MKRFAQISIAAAALLGAAAVSLPPAPAAAHGYVAFHVGYAPPPLLAYDQPPCPGYGFIWTPGYWGWDDYNHRYYWVQGAWVRPPRVGYLWTPGYWAWDGSEYVFYDGYWGPTVGFYGGINYGFGYTGWGYEGGYWRDRTFYYNSRVNNLRGFDRRYIYDREVHEDHRFGRTSYAGGRGGVTGYPNRQQFGAFNQPRLGATQQQQHQWSQQNGGRGWNQNVNPGQQGQNPGGHYGYRQGAPTGGSPAVTASGARYGQGGAGQAPGYRQPGGGGFPGSPPRGPQGQFQHFGGGQPGGGQHGSAPQGGARGSAPHGDGPHGGDGRR